MVVVYVVDTVSNYELIKQFDLRLEIEETR